jgi:hypothetical protein
MLADSVTVSSTHVVGTGLKSTGVDGVGATKVGVEKELEKPSSGAEGAASCVGCTTSVALECQDVSMESRDWDSYAGTEGAGGATEATGLSWVLIGRAPALEGLSFCSEWVGLENHDALVWLGFMCPDSCSAAEGNEKGILVEWVKAMLP